MGETSSSHGSLSERVSSRLADLSPAERRVAQYLDSMPTDELVFANAGTLGRLTRSSDATVVRTARKLGYSGLPELKREAGAAMGTSRHPKDRLSQKLTALGRDLGELRRSVFADAIDALELTQDALDDEELQRAIGALAHAREIHVYGYGGSEAAARHLARIAVRMGYRASATSSTGIVLADDLLRIGHGDVVTVFQPGRRLRDLEILFDHAASVGATSILVGGGPLRRELGSAVDIGLVAALGTARVSAESISYMAVADVLAFGLSVLQEERALQSRDLLTHLRQRLTGQRH